MDVSRFSKQYSVRSLAEDDIPDVLALCSENKLYYQYCPPIVTGQSIMRDMKALPPSKELYDKHYVGYYNAGRLIAVMDLIMAYPDEKTAFIGFFMTDVSVQNAGIGSGIISELCQYLPDLRISSVRLGWVKGNPQAEHFWRKNGFRETGITYDTDDYTVVIAQRDLQTKKIKQAMALGLVVGPKTEKRNDQRLGHITSFIITEDERWILFQKHY